MNNCSKCRPCLPCVDCINCAKEEITHRCDGPLTRFVLISRAVELATKQKFSDEVIANALDETLEEFGMVRGEDILLPTGS